MKPALTVDTPMANHFARSVLTIVRGRGATLVDANGNRYLDFGAGIAVNALGYGDRGLARVVARQMKRVVHVSNLYTTPETLAAGERLLEVAGGVGRAPFVGVHFGNSGAEANEAAIKFARAWAMGVRGAGHHRVLSFSNAFHGRTFGALSATPKEAYRRKFAPLVPGFESIAWGDVDALERTLDETFCAVLVEVVQGEGGLAVISQEMVAALNRLTAERGVLLIADEVQTGLGRLGSLFGSSLVGLKPDIITLSKPLAGGLPLSATLVPDSVNAQIVPGDHGTTFGGGPVTAAAARYVIDRIGDPDFLDRVALRAQQLGAGLEEIARRHRCVVETRGHGLLRGLMIDFGAAQADRFPRLVPAARDAGLLILTSGTNVLRIAPPLVISERDIDRGLTLLDTILADIGARRPS